MFRFPPLEYGNNETKILGSIANLTVTPFDSDSSRILDDEGKSYKYLCVKENIDSSRLRGALIKTNDTKLWKEVQRSKAIKTLTVLKEVQSWFWPEHTHDDGASSQKISFLPEKVNNFLFGGDSFDDQQNYNQLVDINKELALDRGGEWMLFNADILSIDRDYKVQASLEPWRWTEFWWIWLFLLRASPLILIAMFYYGYNLAS